MSSHRHPHEDLRHSKYQWQQFIQTLMSKGMTYREIGEKCGVTPSGVSKWINSPQSIPLIDDRDRYIRRLGFDPLEIVPREADGFWLRKLQIQLQKTNEEMGKILDVAPSTWANWAVGYAPPCVISSFGIREILGFGVGNQLERFGVGAHKRVKAREYTRALAAYMKRKGVYPVELADFAGLSTQSIYALRSTRMPVLWVRRVGLFAMVDQLSM